MVYLIRWVNGAITFVDAASENDAIEKGDEYSSFDPTTCHIEKVKNFMLTFDVEFDQKPEPELTYLPGTAIGGRLIGPVEIGQSCHEQIDRQVFACKGTYDQREE
jgi:hypothetical protein